MRSANSDPLLHIRVLLVMGRISNLPTVWSNCLAGWLLGGGGEAARFNLLCLGATLVYLGGMFLNDAFDVGFDSQHRRQRPIPAGLIDVGTVWKLGFASLALGLLTLAWLGKVTGVLALLLVVAVVIYDAVHKAVTLAPVLMALCRLLLYLVAASTTREGVVGLAVWSGLALALYVVGLSYLARHESTPRPVRWWPLSLLAAPVALALVVNTEAYAQLAWWLSLILACWIIRCLRHTFGQGPHDVGRTVAGLLAGIVWVDLLAVAGMSIGICLAFAALFALARLSQRFVPAT